MAAAATSFFSNSISTISNSRPTPNPNFTYSPQNSNRKSWSNPRSSIRHGFSSTLILRFPPNFVRQLSIKARRNCSNIGVAQVVAASWTSSSIPDDVPPSAAASPPAAFALDGAVFVPEEVGITVTASEGGDCNGVVIGGGVDSEAEVKYDSAVFSSDESVLIHAGERYGRRLQSDSITTPLVSTTAYWFKDCKQLIDFKEGRHPSYEYGRYGNPTTEVLEIKMKELERAESTMFVSSGMYAACSMFSALVPAGGHIVTTTDCYRRTRMFIENELPLKGISCTVIAPDDMDALERALNENKVSLFFTETPTNPFLRCIDIEFVSELCHKKGALVCIDGTFAPPVNQKPLTFGADLVIHSATKYLSGHNDAVGGCISGSKELVSRVRNFHHVFGGLIDPNTAYMIIRGMKTLQLRVQYLNSIALRMAQILEDHPKILRVYYPGLPSHPEHHIAKKQMTGFGGVVSFELAGGLEETAKFIDALKIPYIAPSFGGCESIVDPPAILSYWDSKELRDKYGIGENLIRYSFGLEGFEDVKADILQALEAI